MMSDVKLRKIALLRKEIERQHREEGLDTAMRDVLFDQVVDYVDKEVYYDIFQKLRKIDLELEEKGAYTSFEF